MEERANPGRTRTHTPTVDEERGGEYPADLYRFERHAPMSERLDDLGEADLSRYREQGFLAVRQAFELDRVRAALAGLSHLIIGGEPGFDGIQFERDIPGGIESVPPEERQDHIRKLMWFTDLDRRLQTMAEDPTLISVVRRIMGGREPRLFQDMALLKPPRGGREKPWHQDKAFFDLRLDVPIVGVWIALDDANPENGCMHVIPGSHREGPRLHFSRRDYQICDTDVQTWRDVMVPLPPGGLLFFDGLIHHGTPRNHSEERRRAVQFHYAPADAVTVDKEQRLAIFGAEGKDATC
ncbi:MAG TPA: phytanoyl-CoA dioxygenase family protein [Candidatus Dormibacteraeota bacterium]|nr:phytanoyl-CoA dioxygenase family protein [Candidatus Dormibacteraeota bacterium]